MKSEMMAEMLICECNSTEHQIVVYHDNDTRQAYCQIHLTTNKNFFQRLWTGLRYAFEYKCRYGNWDEFILSNKHAGKLRELSEKLAQ